MQSFRLGSIFGFEIRVDLSWFIIFFLILWTFIGSVFPGNYPGLSQATYIIMGVIATLLFFASLLGARAFPLFRSKSQRHPSRGDYTICVWWGIAYPYGC